MPRRAFVVIATRDPELLGICARALTRHTPRERLHLVVVEGRQQQPSDQFVCEEELGGLPRSPASVSLLRLTAQITERLYGRITYSSLVHLGTARAHDGPSSFPCSEYFERPDDEDLFVFCNDDAVVMPGWLEQMAAELDALEEHGIRPGLLGARSNCVSGPQCSLSPPPAWAAPFPIGPHPATDPRLAGVFPWPRIVSFFCATTVAAYRESGGFDVSNPAHQWADDALSVRMLAHGRSNFVSGAFVAHFGSQTLRNLAGEASASAARFNKDLALGREWFERAYPDAVRLQDEERRRWYGR